MLRAIGLISRSWKSWDPHSITVIIADQDVPDELAPELERAIRNGRQVHELMVEAGRRYALALKNEQRSRRN